MPVSTRVSCGRTLKTLVALVESGWSVKALQRVIVLSNTYQQSSEENPAAAAVDPDNQLEIGRAHV